MKGLWNFTQFILEGDLQWSQSRRFQAISGMFQRLCRSVTSCTLAKRRDWSLDSEGQIVLHIYSFVLKESIFHYVYAILSRQINKAQGRRFNKGCRYLPDVALSYIRLYMFLGIFDVRNDNNYWVNINWILRDALNIFFFLLTLAQYNCQ